MKNNKLMINYPKKFNSIIKEAVKKEASDIHISVNHPPVLRIAKILTPLENYPVINSDDSRKIALSLLTKEQWGKFIKNKEIDLGYDAEGARFRINIYFERGHINLAIRVISQQIKTIEKLNLPPVLHKITESLQGFVLITGASSQGKSTTLASLINEINNQKKVHIITIEDPIEYVFKDNKSLIDQREIHKDALSFPKALRSSLREDPDVIMVGELRDLETISTAITAAETGHLVLATLHTNSASQTIHRIIDVFPSHQQAQIKAQLSSSLLSIVTQKLIATQEGLVPACEVLFNNSAVSNLIREGKIHEIPAVVETSADRGMFPLNKSLADLVAKGLIDKEKAISHSFRPLELKQRLGR